MTQGGFGRLFYWGGRVRVLYLLLLLPLGALASCPAGLKLSNVPISTALPFCVKWESSSLGGCEVACPGVCVELPGADSKGPIETTGSECKLGGGGDGGGDGDGGTGGGDAPYDYPFKNQISPIGVGGAYQEGTTAALKQIDEDLRWFAIKNYGQGKEMVATFDSFGKDLIKVTDALTVQSSSFEEYGKTQFSILTTLGRTEDTLQQLTNCVVNPKGNNCEHLGGGGGGGGSKIYDELSQFHQDMFGPNFAEYNQGATMYGKLSSVGYDIQSMSGRIHEMASDVHNLYTYVMPDLRNNSIEMNRNIRSIAESIKNGGIGGGGEGQGVDYSKMPGSADNPLHVAGAEYESGLCQDGDNCAFDLGRINKEYEDKKGALTEKYKEIKSDITEVFKFQLSGSASVPKCFDLFSIDGKSFSVCPEVDGYWEILAAIMLFIFYFVALMIVARR